LARKKRSRRTVREHTVGDGTVSSSNINDNIISSKGNSNNCSSLLLCLPLTKTGEMGHLEDGAALVEALLSHPPLLLLLPYIAHQPCL